MPNWKLLVMDACKCPLITITECDYIIESILLLFSVALFISRLGGQRCFNFALQ